MQKQKKIGKKMHPSIWLDFSWTLGLISTCEKRYPFEKRKLNKVFHIYLFRFWTNSIICTPWWKSTMQGFSKPEVVKDVKGPQKQLLYTVYWLGKHHSLVRCVFCWSSWEEAAQTPPRFMINCPNQHPNNWSWVVEKGSLRYPPGN